MKLTIPVWLTLLACMVGCDAQMVTPATPKSFTPREIGGRANPGVEVMPKPATATRYTTHIVLTESRIWSRTDGKSLQGKLIAFEDLVAEIPKGSSEPAIPPQPVKPTVIRNAMVRLLVDKKPFEVAMARLSAADQELIHRVQASFERKTAAPPPSTP